MNLSPVVRIHTPDASPADTSARPVATTGAGANAIPFVYLGALTDYTSPPVTPHVDLQVTGLSATMQFTSTADVIVALLKNGTQVHSVTLPAGHNYARATFAAEIFAARTDFYQLQTQYSGGDAFDLGGEIELS